MAEVDDMYDWAEAAALLRVRESWLRYKVKRREIPFTPIGRNYRFSRENLLAIQQMGRAAAKTTPAPAQKANPSAPAPVIRPAGSVRGRRKWSPPVA